MVLYLLVARRLGAFELALMAISPAHALRCCASRTGLTLAFIYVPLLVIALYAFNERRTQTWPIPGFTLEWFGKAFHNPGVRDALLTSLKAGARRDGDRARCSARWPALAVARYRFFGREAVSFLVILPIALPGIVTGMALNATFREVLEPFGVGLGLFTVIVGHATFCIVVDLQQRRRAAAADVALVRGGVGRPRRVDLADVPLRHAPGAALGAGGGRAARVRALLRRGDRHDVHRRRRSRRCRSGSSPTCHDPTSCPIVNVVGVLVIAPVGGAGLLRAPPHPGRSDRRSASGS